MSHSNDLATLLRALAFSADKHRNQRRKDADASPYINHPIALANVLANEGAVADVVPLVDGLRGVHPALEAEFDRIAATGRSRFSETEP